MRFIFYTIFKGYTPFTVITKYWLYSPGSDARFFKKYKSGIFPCLKLSSCSPLPFFIQAEERLPSKFCHT